MAESDSLALIELYTALDGPNWTHSWDLNTSIKTWYGLILDDCKLIGIDLSDNHLGGTIPDLNIPSLEVLDLSLNFITDTIPNFSNLTNLRSLNLSHTALTGSIPAFNNMDSLVSLDLSINHLESCPDLTTLPKLDTLKIDRNSLTFKDILPNLTLFIGDDASDNSYAPQYPFDPHSGQKIILGIGEDYTVDLSIDSNLMTNIYEWKRDTLALDTTNSNTYTYTNLRPNDGGVYYTAITNPAAPYLTILSPKDTLLIRDSIKITIHTPDLCITGVDFDAAPFGEEDATPGAAPYECDELKTWNISIMGDSLANVFVLGRLSENGQRVSTVIGASISYVVQPNITYQADFIVIDSYGDTTISTSESIFFDCVAPVVKLAEHNEYILSAGETVSISPFDFNHGSFDNCTSQDKLAAGIWHTSLGSSTPSTLDDVLHLPTNLTLDTTYLGVQSIYIYMIDEAGNWNVDTATATLSEMVACSVSTSDSLALVELYTALDGPHWDSTWNLAMPITTWYGVKLSDDECQITDINLVDNNLKGIIPNVALPNLTFFLVGEDDINGTLPDFSNMPHLLLFQGIGGNLTDVPNLSNHPTLEKVLISGNKLTFEDIIPNEVKMHQNPPFAGYSNQQKLLSPAGTTLVAGSEHTITISDFDENISTNVYEWFKNGTSIGAGDGKSITLSNVTVTDTGQYVLQVTNPNAPDLTLMSEMVAIALTSALPNDDVCNATMLTLDQASAGSFNGATVQENEPYAPGKDCAVNWCDTTLFGSVWYTFVAPATEGVNIEVSSPSNHSDTKIALYSDIDCTSATPFQNALLLDANDDKPGNCCDGSIIALACLTAGETYYVQVDQYEAGQADFNITVNALESCELPCDLIIGDITIGADSCDGNGGYISTKISSPSGQLFITRLLDEMGNPLDTNDHGGFFGHLDAGLYRISVTSLEAGNCTIESELIEIVEACEEGCAPNLTIDVIEKELYHAQQTIISTATLTEDHTTTFKAGTSITLKTGFHAQGVFSAVIEDCEAVLIEETVVESRIALTNTPVLKETVEMKIYPNPFYEATTIAYELPNKGAVTLQVFDFMGKEISTLERGLIKEKGRYTIDFQANQLTSGTYFVVLQSGEYYEVQKLMLLK